MPPAAARDDAGAHLDLSVHGGDDGNRTPLADRATDGRGDQDRVVPVLALETRAELERVPRRFLHRGSDAAGARRGSLSAGSCVLALDGSSCGALSFLPQPIGETKKRSNAAARGSAMSRSYHARPEHALDRAWDLDASPSCDQGWILSSKLPGLGAPMMGWPSMLVPMSPPRFTAA